MDSPAKLDAVIIGLGRAGHHLHIPVLHKMTERRIHNGVFGEVVGLVDLDSTKVSRALGQLVEDYGYDSSQVQCTSALANLDQVDRNSSVVHICTPASDHLATLRAAARAGFKRIIVEKPCAATASEVDEMTVIARAEGLIVTVVNPYLYSVSIEKCAAAIGSGPEQLRYFEFELSKPRKNPTLANRSIPESAFDVEIPHQIATALYLTKAERYSVLRADVRDMHYREDQDPCTIVNNMGLASMVLGLDNCVAVLVSYLDAPTRTRELKLELEDNRRLEVGFPVTEEDHTAVFTEYDSPSLGGHARQLRKEKYPDDLLTRCLGALYTRLLANEPDDLGDLGFNRMVIDILDRAKIFSRVRRFSRG